MNADVFAKLRRHRHDPPTAPAEDLVQRHFLLQDELPPRLAPVAVAVLDPFLRGLIFTDGTVTRALALQTLAPVAVERLGQDEVTVPEAVAAALEADPGSDSVRRRVRISSAGAAALWAESYILPDRLPPGFMGLLDGAPDGIGQSLQRVALESSRELLWFGREVTAPQWSGAEPGTETLRRLYRIVSDRLPAILIEESFAVVALAGGGLRLAGVGDGGGAVSGEGP